MMRPRVRSAAVTALAGLAAALGTYALTGRIVWAVVALLASAFVVNLVAEARSNGRMRFTGTRPRRERPPR